MEKFTKDISEIITTEINNINFKVKGLNFLELLKVSILEKLLKLISKQKFPLDKSVNYESYVKENSRDIKIVVNYFSNSVSISKKKINNDSLFLCFNEASNIDIFKDEKNFKSILLYKNTGISLPKDTLINSNFARNLFLVEIYAKDEEQILTN